MSIVNELKEIAISATPVGSKKAMQVIPLSKAIEIAKDFQQRSITWAVEDFESRAEDMEGENWREIYDEDKFENALTSMIHDHDCNNGITWDSVDHYLDSYCKK